MCLYKINLNIQILFIWSNSFYIFKLVKYKIWNHFRKNLQIIVRYSIYVAFQNYVLLIIYFLFKFYFYTTYQWIIIKFMEKVFPAGNYQWILWMEENVKIFQENFPVYICTLIKKACYSCTSVWLIWYFRGNGIKTKIMEESSIHHLRITHIWLIYTSSSVTRKCN